MKEITKIKNAIKLANKEISQWEKFRTNCEIRLQKMDDFYGESVGLKEQLTGGIIRNKRFNEYLDAKIKEIRELYDNYKPKTKKKKV